MSRYLSLEDLEKLLRKFRKTLGLEDVVYLDPMTVIVKLKLLFPGLNYLRVPLQFMQNEEAQWDSEKRLISIREDVFQGIWSGRGRSRFAIFHEIQHVALGHEGIRNRSLTPTIAERANHVVRREEHDAYRATSIFMAPQHLIRPGENFESIAFRFGLSKSAAKIRREELDKIERRNSGQIRELPSSVRDFLIEAKRKGHKIETDLGD